MNDTDPDRAQAQWWLDPAIAQLAFGASATAAASATSPFDSDRITLDLSDPEQRRLGEFELLELIGEGGMGLVYRAMQTHLQREVAVKLLSAGPWASPAYIERFQQEARHAAKLQHPAIVTVHELGELDGLVYYAMQLVRGESLAQVLKRRGGRLPAREAAALMRTVAEAVDYAHSLGVLHLDLKPANILIGEEGQPRVADFGLSRFMEPGTRLDNLQTAGTPSYMAPEQASTQGATINRATDVWGLGAILYELLCGQPPFESADASTTLLLLREGVIRRPSRYAPMSPDLEAICLKCLARDPGDRYPTARALADELGRFLEGREVSVRPINPGQRLLRWARREPRFAGALAMAVLALVVGLAATTQQWQRADRNAMTASERLWESRREAALQLEQAGEGWQALPLLLDNAKEQAIAGHDEAMLLDRRRIGLLLGQGATLIDTIAIADANPLAVALSEDGSRVAIALSDQSVRWYDTATLEERGRVSLRGRISSGGQARSIVLLRFVGNTRLRATLEWYRHYASPTNGDTWLLDLERGAVLEPPPAFPRFSDANYSDDGRIMLARNTDRQVQLWRTTPSTPLSAPVALPSAGSDALPWIIGPRGRHAMALDAAMQKLHLYALPQLRQLRTLDFPNQAGVSAWAISPDGDHAALGDVEGRVFMLDLQTGALRALPSARGREITWLTFSEDGTWLAAAGVDGRVHAFAAESGDALVSGSMAHDFAVRRVGLSRTRRLLVVAGEGRIALWRLPAGAGSRALPPIRIALAPAMHAQAGSYAVDWSMATGLLASAGIDGQVRLWRMPAGSTAPATTPRQLPESIHADGRRTVDVEWNQLRVASLDGRNASPWLSLAQPPGFAELVGDGRTLVVTVGPQLRIYDAPDSTEPVLRLRSAPIALPNSPQGLLVSRDGRRALLDFGVRHESGFGNQLQLYDLVTGRRLPGELVLQGPLLTLAFSPDGQRIVAIGPTDGATTVLDAQPLRVVGEYPHDPFQPVVAADFSMNGRDLLMLTRAGDPRFGGDALLIWDPLADMERTRHDLGSARPYGVIALERGAFLPAEAGHLVLDGTDLRRLPHAEDAADSTMGAYAVSADRRLLASALRRSIFLYTADGVQLGAPLRIDTAAIDGIAGVAFSPDATRLLARTVGGVAHWTIAPEPRPHVELDALLAKLGTDNHSPQQLRIPSAPERAALRALDPGAWPGRQRRPAPAIAGYAPLDRSPIPARAAGTRDTLLDLSAHYTYGPDSVRNSYGVIRPFLRPFPAGVQRLAGVEFDLRGMVEVDGDGLADCVETPAGRPIAAVHALLLPTIRTRDDRPQLLAELILQYRDGGEARVPIRSGREVQGYVDDRAVPQAFSSKIPRGTLGIGTSTLAAPRLANPQPGRALRCIDLRTTGEPMLILGFTVEPATLPPTAAVIPDRFSR
ncbi:hypothetical protein BH23PSE2_BH23PSE2_08790 [soil metagenome]